MTVSWVRDVKFRDTLEVSGRKIRGSVTVVEMKRGAVKAIRKEIKYARAHKQSVRVPELHSKAERKAEKSDEWVPIGAAQFNPDDPNELPSFYEAEEELRSCIPANPTETTVRAKLARRGITKSIDT